MRFATFLRHRVARDMGADNRSEPASRKRSFVRALAVVPAPLPDLAVKVVRCRGLPEARQPPRLSVRLPLFSPSDLNRRSHFAPPPPVGSRARARRPVTCHRSERRLDLLALAGTVLDHRRRHQWLNAGSRAELALRAQACSAPRATSSRRPAAGTHSLAHELPSSHTAAAVVAISAFEGLLARVPLRCMTLVTAFLRLYVAVHFPSDVLAAGLGCALGRSVH